MEQTTTGAHHLIDKVGEGAAKVSVLGFVDGTSSVRSAGFFARGKCHQHVCRKHYHERNNLNPPADPNAICGFPLIFIRGFRQPNYLRRSASGGPQHPSKNADQTIGLLDGPQSHR
jgi:hypothetical protein